MESFLRDVVVTLSAFSVFSALFTATLCLRMLRSDLRRYSAFAAAKVGYAIVAGLVLLRILLPSRELPVEPATIIYAAGLMLAALGFVGVGRAVRRDYVEWETEQHEAKRNHDLEHIDIERTDIG